MKAYNPNIEPVILAMVSAQGMDREFTKSDITSRAKIRPEDAKSGLQSCVKRGLVVSQAVSAAPQAPIYVYRMTDAGRELAEKLMASRCMFKSQRVAS